MKNRNKNIVLIVTAFLIVGMGSSFMLQSPSSTFKDSNAKIKAIYIFNFAINTNWPNDMKSGDFKIGIYGNYPTLEQNFTKLSQTKKVGPQSIKTVSFSNINTVKDCHILYVDSDKTRDFEAIQQKFKDKPTLILTDKSGYGKKGGCINFYNLDNKQKFEINKGAFSEHKLQVSSRLLDLADAVY